jgi:hypothetical protein
MHRLRHSPGLRGACARLPAGRFGVQPLYAQAPGGAAVVGPADQAGLGAPSPDRTRRFGASLGATTSPGQHPAEILLRCTSPFSLPIRPLIRSLHERKLLSARSSPLLPEALWGSGALLHDCLGCPSSPAAWHSPRRPLLLAVVTLPHHPSGVAEPPMASATPLRTLLRIGARSASSRSVLFQSVLSRRPVDDPPAARGFSFCCRGVISYG